MSSKFLDTAGLQYLIGKIKSALDLKANVTNVLTKDNTTPYTPTLNYHPATKKYVDEAAAASGVVSSVFGRTGAVTAQAGDYTKAQVGLGNVDNTSDLAKPVSTAQQSALDLKADIATTYSKTQVDTLIESINKTHYQVVDTALYPTIDSFLASTGTEGYMYLYPIDKTDLSKGYVQYIWEPGSEVNYTSLGGTAMYAKPISTLDTIIMDIGTSPYTIKIGSGSNFSVSGNSWVVGDHTVSGQYGSSIGIKAYYDDGEYTEVNRYAIISQGSHWISLGTTAQIDLSPYALNADLTAHTGNTSNPHSVTKAQVGLGNVDNTSDANKPVSTATQTALNLKAPLASPALTGTPTAPTAAQTVNNTQIATTAYVRTAVGDLATVASTGAYSDLSGKPTIGSTNLKIQKNGTDIATFSSNQTGNTVTANITVPTKVSDLTNDAGYTSNAGTITGVTAGNGLTGGGTSGSVSLGLASIVTAKTTQALYPVKIDAYGRITDIGTAVSVPTAGSTVQAIGTASAGSATTWSRSDHVHNITSGTITTALGYTPYQKPSSGIPKTDLESSVQTSLGKADTALQSHQSLANYYTKSEVDAMVISNTDIDNAWEAN